MSGYALSVGNFADLQRQSTVLERVSASVSASFNLASEGAPERISGELVSAGYFATFGVQPIVGRAFSGDMDRPGHPQMAVLSEPLWRNRFHSDRSLLGQAIHVNGLSYVVVGVMPKSFDPLLSNSQIWMPAAFTPRAVRGSRQPLPNRLCPA